MSMSSHWFEGDGCWTVANGPDDPAMSPGDSVTSGPCICLLDFACCKDLLVHDDYRTEFILPGGIRPDPGDDVSDGVNDVTVPIVPHLAVRSLCRVACNGYLGID